MVLGKNIQKFLEVTKEILTTIKDIWNNPAFGPNFVYSLNKGTYVSNAVVPLIHATLKNLPCKMSSIISTYERQSNASKDRRGEDKTGRRPDIMFEELDNKSNYGGKQTMDCTGLAEIPVNPVNGYNLTNFVKGLLTLRNIIIVNMALLFHAPISIPHRQEQSSTVLTP
ncbi:10564_t:CDS:2 [Dentiscutata heterogama]|uniref:10564_t:CDS:1 n=1 Tax=Dentiscutata heterogama TaxID=1316150 RepID=A0ACA9K1E0_9GLOM|nr:10564_t:CDS:2 [Dentiscutata heterogama]